MLLSQFQRRQDLRKFKKKTPMTINYFVEMQKDEWPRERDVEREKTNLSDTKSF